MSTANGVATMTMYDVLTLSEAAAYLKVSESEVKAEAETGRLVGRAVGDDWRFARDELFRWLKPVRRVPQTTPAWTAEAEAECEREIAAIYADRHELGTVGDNYPDTDSTSADD